MTSDRIWGSAPGPGGGTLRLYGPAHLDPVDPACAYQPAADQITRLFARRLFGYQPEADLRDWRAVAPVPDLATNIPSTYNTGMGARHLNYVVHLRRGVLWDTTPARELTAADVVRGLKRLGNPVHRSPLLPYFTSTIRGMAKFCEDYAASMPEEPTAEELADYQNSHEIPGVFVLDDESLVIELERPALDFPNIMALPCSAPAPAEYDAFVPDSAEFRRNVRSNGPYRLVHDVSGSELRLERNPVWRQGTDPIRRQHVDAITLTMGTAPAREIAKKISRGTVDLPWGIPVSAPRAGEAADPGDGLGYGLSPYLVFNLHTTAGAAAVRDVRFRRAVCYAVNKMAIAEILGEFRPGTATRAAGSIIPPGNDAHQELDPYATPGHRGDPGRCRALLAEAGYPDGVRLTAIHCCDEVSTRISQSLAADLEKARIAVRLVPLGYASYHRLLRERPHIPAGDWDITATSWWPAWFRGNARVFLQPMFESASPVGTANAGHYRNPEVVNLIEFALASVEDPARAEAAWREAEGRVLADAGIVPILFQRPVAPYLRSSRVRGGIPLPAAGYTVDLSSVWLDPAE